MSESDIADAREDLYKERRVGAPARRGAVYWPILTDEEALEEWQRLRIWVELLRARFPNSLRLPDCWWQHNDLVEALSALRDHERASYAPEAPGTGPVDFHRALRDLEARIDTWIKRFTCTMPGRGHRPLDADLTQPIGWDEHLATDSATRPVAAAPAADER